MNNLLIAPIYEKKDAFILSIKKFNIQNAIIFIDEEIKPEQKKLITDLDKLMQTNVVNIEKQKISDIDNVVQIAKLVMRIIDSHPNDEIFIDVTQGVKTQMLGILFGCYARYNRIKKIVYWTIKDKKLINLPKFSFSINKNKKFVLENIEQSTTLNDLTNKMKISRTMLYNYIKDLETKGYLEKNDDVYVVTDMGKIALLSV